MILREWKSLLPFLSLGYPWTVPGLLHLENQYALLDAVLRDPLGRMCVHSQRYRKGRLLVDDSVGAFSGARLSSMLSRRRRNDELLSIPWSLSICDRFS